MSTAKILNEKGVKSGDSAIISTKVLDSPVIGNPVPIHFIVGNVDKRMVFMGPYQSSFDEAQWNGEKPIDLAWDSKLLDLSSKINQSFVSVGSVCKDPLLRAYNSPKEEEIIQAVSRACTIPTPNGDFPEDLILVGSSTGGYGVLAYSSFFPGKINETRSGTKVGNIEGVVAIAPWMGFDNCIIKNIINLNKIGINPGWFRKKDEELKRKLEDYIGENSPKMLPFYFPKGKEKHTIDLPIQVYQQLKESNLLELVSQNKRPTLIFGHRRNDRIPGNSFRTLAKTNSGPTYLCWVNTDNSFYGKDTREFVLDKIQEFYKTGKCEGKTVEFYPAHETPEPTKVYLEKQKIAQDIQTQTKYQFRNARLS